MGSVFFENVPLGCFAVKLEIIRKNTTYFNEDMQFFGKENVFF